MTGFSWNQYLTDSEPLKCNILNVSQDSLDLGQFFFHIFFSHFVEENIFFFMILHLYLDSWGFVAVNSLAEIN